MLVDRTGDKGVVGLSVVGMGSNGVSVTVAETNEISVRTERRTVED